MRLVAQSPRRAPSAGGTRPIDLVPGRDAVLKRGTCPRSSRPEARTNVFEDSAAAPVLRRGQRVIAGCLSDVEIAGDNRGFGE